MSDRVKCRRDAKGILEGFFGGYVRFTGDDKGAEDGTGEIGFVVESGRPNNFGRAGLERIERDLYDRGYDADVREGSHRLDQPGTRFSGTIRPMTAVEKLERTQREKPKWNSDSSWMVDGEEYDDEDQDMLAWKSAMKKYGSQVKAVAVGKR